VTGSWLKSATIDFIYAFTSIKLFLGCFLEVQMAVSIFVFILLIKHARLRQSVDPK